MKQFYKKIQIIKFCKVCNVMFRPDKDSTEAQKKLCWEHRFNERTKKRFRMTPAEKKEFRRLQVLASYHKQKHLHKGRRHRRVIPK